MFRYAPRSLGVRVPLLTSPRVYTRMLPSFVPSLSFGFGQQQQERGIKTNANSLNRGMVIELEAYPGRLFKIVSLFRAMMGRRDTYIQLEVRDIANGNKLPVRLRSSEKVEQIVIDIKKMNYLYREGEVLFMMDPGTFEQIEISSELVSGNIAYLLEDTEVDVEVHAGSIVNVVLPRTVVAKIKATTEINNKATTSKQATIDLGVVVTVPIYVEQGDTVVIKTETDEFVERLAKAPSS
jgi:translation elongation factor P